MSALGAIILCRMDSSRLPGKALRTTSGVCLLDLVIERCRSLHELRDHLVVATTARDVDRPLLEHARERGVRVFRGSTTDVAGRALACARQFGLEGFLRINADSPFLHGPLLREGISVWRRQNLDLVTNLVPRSYPYGVSLELIRTEAFERAYAAMSLPEHHEHVTKYLYETLPRWRHRNLTNALGDQSHERLTVDTAADWDWFEGLARHYGPALATLDFAEALRFRRQGV